MSAQEYNYMDRNNQQTGVKYAIGPVPSGGTKIAYVRYPKGMYRSAEDIRSDPNVPIMLERCNVCSFMDQEQARTGVHPLRRITPVQSSVSSSARPADSDAPADIPAVQAPGQVPMQEPGQAIDLAMHRFSAGQFVSPSTLPKYSKFALDLLKNSATKPLGNAAVSMALSFLADMYSGAVQDPGLKHMYQCLSDELIDPAMCTAEFGESVQENLAEFAEAIYKDGDVPTALKRSMFRSKDEILAPLRNRSKKGISANLTRTQTTNYNLSVGPRSLEGGNFVE
jgi:hypothetical protein